ncbi:MAG: asparaginase [Gemmatimonadaceae bacterium]
MTMVAVAGFKRRVAVLGTLAVMAAAASLIMATPRVTAAQSTKPRVHVIATGGTISNLGNDSRRTGAELITGIGDLSERVTVTVEQFSNVASGAITQDMWRSMARRISEISREPNAPVGFVITHGTDTMEETAFFLDLTVSGCAPVILTGAMRQASAVGADGPANLRNAIRLAASPGAQGRGTMILMNDEIFAARDVTKSNTSRMNAFTAPDAGPLGVADPDTIAFYRERSSGCHAARFALDKIEAFPRVDVVYAYIGADSVTVDALVNAGARGLVLAGVGRGGATPAMGRALRRAVDKGVYLAISNRTGSGRTGSGAVQDTTTTNPERGETVGAGTLNPQKARVLLMLALAAHMDARAISDLFRAY